MVSGAPDGCPPQGLSHHSIVQPPYFSFLFFSGLRKIDVQLDKLYSGTYYAGGNSKQLMYVQE
jgi:hypothetical protein